MKYIQAIKNPKVIQAFEWEEVVRLVKENNGKISMNNYEIYELMGDTYVNTDNGVRTFKPNQVLVYCDLDGAYPIDINIFNRKFLKVGEGEIEENKEVVEEEINESESTKEVA